MKKLLILVLVLILAGLGFYWYTKSGKVVQDEFPTVAIEVDVDQQTDSPETPENRESQELTMQPLPKVMKGEDLVTEMSEEEVKEMMKQMDQAEEVTVMEDMMTTSAETNTMPVPSRQGSFGEVDLIHKAVGTAKIFPDTSDGAILRLEDFNVTNGPDLYVYMSKNSDVKAQGLGEYVSVAKLKGSKGNQNYPLPEGYEDYNSVVIWCQAFGVLFSYAPLN